MPEVVGPASPDRRAPICRHFGICGGCVAQHMSDALYADWKRGIVVEAFRQRGLTPEVAPLLRVPPGSRRRAVLTCKRAGESDHARLPRPPQPRPVRPRGVPGAGARNRGRAAGPARHRRPAAGGRKPLHGAGDTRRPRCERGGKAPQPRCQSRCRHGPDRRRSSLRAHHDGRRDDHRAGIADVADLRRRRACRRPAPSCRPSPRPRTPWRTRCIDRIGRPKRAADLFCGLGTFALALARRSRVAAFDSDQAAMAALQAAVRHASGLKPVEARVRDLFREPLSPRELAPFDAVVLDPPRAGAKAQCEALAKSEVPSIVYVSCDPATLARDARTLVDAGYRLGEVVPIDQFLFSRPRRAGRRVHALMPSRSATPLNGPPTNICHLGVCWWGGWGTALLGEVLHACVGMAVHRAVLGERAPYAGRPRRPSAGSRAVPRPQPASPRQGVKAHHAQDRHGQIRTRVRGRNSPDCAALI